MAEISRGQECSETLWWYKMRPAELGNQAEGSAMAAWAEGSIG